jgi:class 3 adenylate cyclase/PAS domain-containing protein
MSWNETLLQRTLDPSQATAMLSAFAALSPGLGVAFLGPELYPVFSAGHWPGTSSTEMRAAAREALSSDGAPIPVTVEGQQLRFYPFTVSSRPVGTLVIRGRLPGTDDALERGFHRLFALLLSKTHESHELGREALEGYRELNLLYRVVDSIGRSLDPETLPQLVLEEAHRVITADAGLVTLGHTAASFGDVEQMAALEDTLHTVIDDLWNRNRSAILSDLTSTGGAWGSVLWVPLRTTERVLGGVVLGRRAPQSVFTASDEKILSALAGPSALALQNANLFDDLRQTLDRTIETKALLDDVVASIASGVLTTDRHELVTFCNEAAARILDVAPAQAVRRPLRQVLTPGFSRLGALIGATAQRGAVTLNHHLTVPNPGRATVHLYVSCTPLVDARGVRTGAAVVLNDMTEQRKVEAERERIRETFGRVVAPRVRDRLLAEPSHLLLDGSRHTVTVLFADLHGFTPFCERTSPEAAFKVLNSYLSLAANAVLAEEGTLDKFIGDAVMAFWNAPDAQADHALRAARAAVGIACAARAHRTTLPEDHRLDFRIAIHTGDAIVGNVGTAELFNYTVIGDAVNLTQRLEGLADPGRILLSEETYGRLAGKVVVGAQRQAHVKGREHPVLAYELESVAVREDI